MEHPCGARLLLLFTFMRNLFLSLLFCLLTCQLFAQKTEDMYVMRLSQEGSLFFIRPNTLNGTINKANLQFDITHLNSTDTASIKMTTYENTLLNIDSVALLAGDSRYVCNAVIPIYKEKENKSWVHRSDCAFPYRAVKEIMISEEAPTVMVYTDKGTSSYTLAASKWKNLRTHMLEIFMIIDYSKR